MEDSTIDMHKHGIYCVVDVDGDPVPETTCTTGYGARAQFMRSQNKLWGRAVEQGYRIAELQVARTSA
jgi:hypothetical protein